MAVNVEIDPGVCGLVTKATAHCEDGQHVTFEVTSACEKVSAWAEALCARGPVDAYQEIHPKGVSVVLSAPREAAKGCCAGCVVSAGLFKAMQVAAGLALPKDVQISIKRT